MEAFDESGGSRRSKRFGTPVTLMGAQNAAQWRRWLQTAYYALTKDKTDLSKMSIKRIMNYVYYSEKHPALSKEFLKLSFMPVAAPVAPPVNASGTSTPVKPVPVTGKGAKKINADAMRLYKSQVKTHLGGLQAGYSSDSSTASDSSGDESKPGAVVKNKAYEDWLNKAWDHARTEHGKYAKWVPQFWMMIQNSLCESIQENITGVVMGDIPTALISIQISIGQLESLDPHNLFLEFAKSTFQDEGKNNWQTYDNHMKYMLNRIQAVDPKLVTDKMAQVALIGGLKKGPQYKVFERIIAKYDKGTATSYEALRAKISRHVAQPMVLEELTKLRPMTNARLHLTMDNRSPKTKKICELEAIVANITAKSSTRFVKTDKACYNFLKGACSRQDCKFSHAIDPSSEKKWCEFHKTATHNAKDCRSNLGNQSQVASAASGMTKKQLVAYVAQLEAANLPFTVAMVRHQILAAAHELRPKDFIMDNAATSHCIKNPILMMEGSMKPCTMNLEGLGSLKTTEAGDVLLKCEGYAPGTACGILKLTGAPCSLKFPANIISEIKLRKHGIIPHVVCIQQGRIVNGLLVGEIYESHYKNQEGKLILKARTNASGLLVACVL